jgi:hypothetical protein
MLDIWLRLKCMLGMNKSILNQYFKVKLNTFTFLDTDIVEAVNARTFSFSCREVFTEHSNYVATQASICSGGASHTVMSTL